MSPLCDFEYLQVLLYLYKKYFSSRVGKTKEINCSKAFIFSDEGSIFSKQTPEDLFVVII